jgi:hypothetical protein
MDDLVIRGAEVIDGSGAPARRVDVAVRDGRIAAIGTEARPARRVVDATGRVLAPGFIDIHTHSDFTLPLNPRAEGKIRQGVTTEVLGNCGYSAAPAPPGRAEELRNYLAASAPWLPFRETTFAGYLDSFPPTSVNTVMQVGHNTLRLMAMHMENRQARPAELAVMEGLLEEALDAGALGLSSGLFTAPGSYADSDELHALGRVLRRHGGAYASHIRNEAGEVFEAVDRLRISSSRGRRTGAAPAGCSRASTLPVGAGYPSTATSIHTRRPPIRSATCCPSGSRTEASPRCSSGSVIGACASASARTSRRGDMEASATCRPGTPCAWQSRRISPSTPGRPSARSPGRAARIRWTRPASTSWRTRGTRA